MHCLRQAAVYFPATGASGEILTEYLLKIKI
jgi:hypothetical protein